MSVLTLKLLTWSHTTNRTCAIIKKMWFKMKTNVRDPRLQPAEIYYILFDGFLMQLDSRWHPLQPDEVHVTVPTLNSGAMGHRTPLSITAFGLFVRHIGNHELSSCWSSSFESRDSVAHSCSLLRPCNDDQLCRRRQPPRRKVSQHSRTDSLVGHQRLLALIHERISSKYYFIQLDIPLITSRSLTQLLSSSILDPLTRTTTTSLPSAGTCLILSQARNP